MKTLIRFTLIGLLLTVLFFVTFFGGCRGPQPFVLRFYCNETFWIVMQEEAKAFEQVYGIRTELVPLFLMEKATKETKVKSPYPPQSDQWEPDSDLSKLITSLSDNRNGDIYLTDSSLEHDRLKSYLLPAYEYPFCFLTMALWVPKGNPEEISSVRDVLESKLRLGITAPSKDGSGIVASDIISKLTIADSSEHVEQFDRQEDLLQALEEKRIDAALLWDSTNIKSYLTKKYAEEYYAKYKNQLDAAKKKWNIDEMTKLIDKMFTELFKDKAFTDKILLKKPSDDESVSEHRVIQVAMISLSTSLHDAEIRLFADFLLSNQGREILRKHDFVPK